MGSITDIKGIKVGHVSDFEAITGCTVMLFESPATAAVDLRGGGTSTRQIDSLLSHNTFGKIHAILLTGGSAYGLDATSGVIKYLEEKNVGLEVGGGIVVPSVPTAVIFDLGIGNGRIRPDAQMGYEACMQAKSSQVEEGSIGAGTGATIGKLMGLGQATKGGIGTESYKLKNGVIVGVLVVVNAFGDVVSPTNGQILAGVRDSNQGNEFLGTLNLFKQGIIRRADSYQNTTLAVVVTNASFSKSELLRISTIAQTGLAKVISPVHTSQDGDMVISVSLGDLKEDVNLLGVIAAELTQKAIIRAVEQSTTLGGIPCSKELLSNKAT
ncbi:MAG: P1 family peptidase [Deltaproteobacteria bacterium]|nr:P1 family peptidase [Deltaproteobacteria bacterium]